MAFITTVPDRFMSTPLSDFDRAVEIAEKAFFAHAKAAEAAGVPKRRALELISIRNKFLNNRVNPGQPLRVWVMHAEHWDPRTVVAGDKAIFELVSPWLHSEAEASIPIAASYDLERNFGGAPKAALHVHVDG